MLDERDREWWAETQGLWRGRRRDRREQQWSRRPV